jgi:hypothetical protein
MDTNEQLRTALKRTLRLKPMTDDPENEMVDRLCETFLAIVMPAVERSAKASGPEPRVPAYDPTRHHLPTDFPDIAEGYLREMAQKAHYQWANTKREAEQRMEALAALWEEFERFEDAADVLMRARGGGPQPGLFEGPVNPIEARTPIPAVTENGAGFLPPKEGRDY